MHDPFRVDAADDLEEKVAEKPHQRRLDEGQRGERAAPGAPLGEIGVADMEAPVMAGEHVARIADDVDEAGIGQEFEREQPAARQLGRIQDHLAAGDRTDGVGELHRAVAQPLVEAVALARARG